MRTNKEINADWQASWNAGTAARLREMEVTRRDADAAGARAALKSVIQAALRDAWRAVPDMFAGLPFDPAATAEVAAAFILRGRS